MALDTTVGGSSANAYCDITFADAYIHDDRLHPHTAWDALGTHEKESALRMATILLDQLEWKGTKYYEDGALRWPRDGVYDRDGLEVSVLTHPLEIQRATAEWALILTTQGDTTSPLGDPGSAGLQRVKVDVIELEFDTESRNPTQKKDPVPDSVRLHIQHWLKGTPMTMRVVRT